MDIYQALKKDHEVLKPLLQKLVACSEMNEDTQELLTQIRNELVPHARAEEAVFYNSLRQVDAAKSQVTEGYKEHTEAELLLRSLQAMSKISVEWKKGAQKLQDGILHHIEEEESKIFALGRQYLLDEEARQMAQAFERIKPEVRESGFMQNTLDMVANIMPKRFADSVRSFKV